jgi:hypothetical protein
MLDDHSGVRRQERVTRDVVQTRRERVDIGIGRIGEEHIIRAVPSIGLPEKLLHRVAPHHHPIGHAAVGHVATEQRQRLAVRLHAGHVGGASAEGFDADRSRAGVQIQKAATRHARAEYRKQRFPNTVGRRTYRGSQRASQAPASMGSSNHTHIVRALPCEKHETLTQRF